MKSTLLKTIVASSLLSVLAACSSDDSSSSNSGYVQLYNGSYNSPYTRLFVDDTERSGADFGDVSTRHNYSSGEYELSFEYVDANDSYITIDEETIKIKNDQTQLLVMIGDFAEPIFTELSVPTSSDEDEFNVGFFNIVGEDNLYDVYVATDDGLFDTAELLMTSQYLVEPELATLEEGYYTIYITASGSTDVIFESPTVYFNDEATYMAMIRPSYATEEDGITLDVVTASSSVTQLNHQDAQGQLRFINTIDDYTQTQFKVTRGTTATNTEVVSNDSYSEYMSMSPNSYSVAMLDEAGDTIVDNFLMTLEREQSAVGLFYNDKDYGPRMMTIEENLTPSSYSHAVTVVNLIDSYAGQEIDEVDVYFTLNGETVEDTSNVVEGLDQYDQQEQVVDNEVYTTYVVFEDNGQQIVLLQQSDMDFTEEGNYILVIEHDETTDSGFKMTLERTVTEQS
ncbi:hypothetical protein GBO14_08245 [Pseudoalteromonas shioyasakiensis]|uniref:hypothetical protein n=1 Tax=Pseudoalteromonas shioyasakiensis TaxID=1190813 RepID=UPI00209539C3|nr:hypothetical protein [Pseudoalteromonas shioyasakiensis]MCO6354707.1 hypothetical protein [Pseudoalteromonas shioyasakiensis]